MKDALRWLTLLIVLVVAGTGLYYSYQQSRPCAQPIHYAIGDVASGFGTTDAVVLKEAQAASALWNAAEHKQVFVYDPNAALKINLIYDSRQANAKLGVQIAQKQADENAARASLDAAQAQFTSEQNAYNQTVTAINARGGATRAEAVALNEQRASLNALADSLNARVAAFNASVDALNAVISQYNQTAGHTFEEGEYVRDASGERINVYEFIGNSQLERVLAHEFGHALGLGHNSDPKSIMYAENESGNPVPTASDLAALRAVCGA